jgi:hypothetical protein
MLKTITLIFVACILAFPAFAKDKNIIVRERGNDVEIITTSPDLPAEVVDPARERRNYDWLEDESYHSRSGYDNGHASHKKKKHKQKVPETEHDSGLPKNEE